MLGEGCSPWLQLGFRTPPKGIDALGKELFDVMAPTKADFTLTFRELALVLRIYESDLESALAICERCCADVEQCRAMAGPPVTAQELMVGLERAGRC